MVLRTWVAQLVGTPRNVRSIILILDAMWVEQKKATPVWMGRERMPLTIKMVKLKIRLYLSSPRWHRGGAEETAPLILVLGTSR